MSVTSYPRSFVMEIEDKLVEERSGRKKRRGRIICALVFVLVVLVCAIAIPIVISQSKPQYQYDHSANFVVKLHVQDDVMVDCTGREGTESECRKNGYVLFLITQSRPLLTPFSFRPHPHLTLLPFAHSDYHHPRWTQQHYL